MKLLYMSVHGSDLFQNGLEIDFVARQRVTDNNNESLSHLFGAVYKQDILGIIGINASGKTMALRWISFLLHIYLQEGKVNDETYQSLLPDQTISMKAFFSNGTHLYKVESTIGKDENRDPCFVEEKLWKKKEVKSLSRKSLLQFSDSQLKLVRSNEQSPFLSDYVSIMISERKKQAIRPLIVDQLKDTNINLMRVLGDVPEEVIKFLDNRIEYVNYEGHPKEDMHIRLKFKNQNKIITIYDPIELGIYLSSGTIKGLNVFAGIQNVLATSGFLIVDELENHFNEAIVKLIIQLFKHKKINVTGATLVFTTHYAMLLDEFDRNDSIYISFKGDSLQLKNLYGLLQRNDFKKSEVYQSSYVGKTALSYDDYMALKKYFLQEGKEINQRWRQTNE